MKKGRHRRFEEARALKRDNSGADETDYASWLQDNDQIVRSPEADDDKDGDDPYAKYADTYDDGESDADDTPSR